MTAARTGLVLLSGTLGTERLWDEVVARLDGPVTCLRTDQASSVPSIAAAVLDQAPERFALAGHSFGGIVAVEVLRQAPRRIERLALLSASARPASEEQVATWDTWRRRIAAGRFEDLVEEVTTASLGTSAGSRTREHASAMAVHAGPTGLLRQLVAQADRPGGLDVLGATDVPLLVVAGTEDAICPVALQREAIARRPHARLVEVPGAGHLSPLEAPDRVAAALDAWWAGPAPIGPDPRRPVVHAPHHRGVS